MVVFVILKTNRKNGRMKDIIVQTNLDPRYESEVFRGLPYRRTTGKFGKPDYYRKDQIMKIVSAEEFETMKKTRKQKKKEQEEKQITIEEKLKNDE